ncbi:MAG: hypothetical protein J7J38_01000 [Candidatus Aenigmarchaeota archaeon]|nr:hypothetical protein [Candidatus Aenigmarchaeota archaeon]
MPFGKDDLLYLDKIRSLKAVYAAADKDNLYLMLEFYGKPRKLTRHGYGLSLKIDNTKDGLYDFEINLDENPSFSKIIYNNEEISTDWKKERQIKVKWGKVIEVKIPKKLVGSDEIEIKVYVPAMCMTWGGINIKL